jgi:hypothetical protein
MIKKRKVRGKKKEASDTYKLTVGTLNKAYKKGSLTPHSPIKLVQDIQWRWVHRTNLNALGVKETLKIPTIKRLTMHLYVDEVSMK